MGKPKKKCSTCLHYQPSPVRGQGWCRNPALRKPHERSLVSSGELACDKKFYDFWEPMLSKSGRAEAPRTEAIADPLAPIAGGPRPTVGTAPQKTEGLPRGYLYAIGALVMALVVLGSLLLLSGQHPEEEVQWDVTATTSTPIPEATTLPTSTPEPTPPSTPTPTAVKAQQVKVTNTDGVGVYIRKTPTMGDRIVAWPDGTVLEVIGPDREAEGVKWVNVRDPRGNEGWVPAQYVTAVN